MLAAVQHKVWGRCRDPTGVQMRAHCAMWLSACARLEASTSGPLPLTPPQVAELNAKVQDLESQYNAAVEDKNAAIRESERCQLKLALANRLIAALASEGAGVRARVSGRVYLLAVSLLPASRQAPVSTSACALRLGPCPPLPCRRALGQDCGSAARRL